MSSKSLYLLLALLAPTIAGAAGLAANQPLSSWRSASAADKQQLIDAIVGQLRTSAGVAAHAPIPDSAIIQCVDGNHTPDTLQIHDQAVKVTAGLAVVLCVRIHMPELQKARYQVRGP